MFDQRIKVKVKKNNQNKKIRISGWAFKVKYIQTKLGY